MAEAVTGIGLMVGPVIGGVLYNAFGYFATFFIFGIILIINLIVAWLITPDSLNKSMDQNGEDEYQGKS